MGVLVRITEPRVMEVLWDCMCLAERFGYSVKGRKDNKTAESIEDALIEVTQERDTMIGVVCKCGEKIKINDQNTSEHYKIPVYRTLKIEKSYPTVKEVPSQSEFKQYEPVGEMADRSTPALIYFEDAEFDMLRAHVDAVIPPQAFRRIYNQLQDLLEGAHAKWRGKELKMRTQLEEMLNPTQPKEEVLDA